MAMFFEGRARATDVEPVGLLTEGAAGIAVIVLSIIALAGTSPGALASIVAIIIGVGLIVQAFNSAAEMSKAMAGNTVAMPDLREDVMVDLLCGGACDDELIQLCRRSRQHLLYVKMGSADFAVGLNRQDPSEKLLVFEVHLVKILELDLIGKHSSPPLRISFVSREPCRLTKPQ